MRRDPTKTATQAVQAALAAVDEAHEAVQRLADVEVAGSAGKAIEAARFDLAEALRRLGSGERSPEHEHRLPQEDLVAVDRQGPRGPLLDHALRGQLESHREIIASPPASRRRGQVLREPVGGARQPARMSW
jgi:hypothetical protein